MGKRNILVVDGNKINRAILKRILQKGYEVLEAENGESALDILASKGSIISAVLLDVVIPIIDGYEVLRQMRSCETMATIPVIVTGDQNCDDAEIRALSLGANDYILKPYKPDIIKHRLANTIYLRETASFVNELQNDQLTGVLNKEFFYKTAREVIENNQDKNYDIICCDIEKFKLINDLYGTETGDRVLKYLGKLFKDESRGMSVCGRLSGDNFAFLAPHSDNYSNDYFKGVIDRANRLGINLKIILKYGIYTVEDINTPITIMCDRANLAKQSIKGKYDEYFAYYNDEARQQLLKEQFITTNMKASLENGEFMPYFQPKYDVVTGKIMGAEALARWINPKWDLCRRVNLFLCLKKTDL